MMESDTVRWLQGWQRSVISLTFACVVALSPITADAICGEGIIDSGGLPCACDCDLSLTVTVDEILTAANIALGISAPICLSADVDLNQSITVDEIITCVNNALNGCPYRGSECPGSVSQIKDCDDGGLCVGGANAGTACTAENECIGDGACFGGIYDLHGCASDDECAGAPCRKCRPYGGDGCAANCTFETDRACHLAPLVIADFGIPGSPSSGSRLEFASSFLPGPVPLTGSQVMTTGVVVDGFAPVVIKAAGLHLDAVEISTVACACIHGLEARTCGGTLFDRDGTLSADCTTGPPDGGVCPADKACAAVHGPGNTASGFIGCGDPGIDIAADCDGPQAVTMSDAVIPTDRGSAQLALTSATGTVVGACTGSDPEYGPDGVFCTADDPLTSRGTPAPIVLTTNSASSTGLSPADFETDDAIEALTTNGAPLTCNVDGSISVTGADLAGAFAACGQPTVADTAGTLNFVCE